MAEPDKADERWIVKEREDGRNVNSWHWEEKQRLPWARERLGTLLLVSAGGGAAAAGVGTATITSVRSVEGEAMTTTRKGGRRFAVYDLKVTCAWSVGEEEEKEGAGAGAGAGAEEEDGDGKEEDDDTKKTQKKTATKPRTGTVVIEELASTHDPDDYVLTFKADGTAAEDGAARDEAQRLLKGPLLAALETFCAEIAAL
jgi:hypothetical protein